MKKILITGASGFVGKYLVNFLSTKDVEIYGTYLKNNDENLAKSAKLTQIDLMDSNAVDSLISDTKPDLIFHLAASTSPRKSFYAHRKVKLGRADQIQQSAIFRLPHTPRR